MKAEKTSDQTHLTREEAIAALQKLASDLGHNPKKSELPPDLHNQIRSLFGKWCYAQEAAGLVVPSERVQEKRRKREEHKARVAERQKQREQEKEKHKQKQRGQAKRQRIDNDKKTRSNITSYHPPED